MQLPLQITFRDIPPSEAVETKIREKAAKLDQYYDRITSCRVVIEMSRRHQNKGKLYHVNIDITVPEGELVVSRSPNNNKTHKDIYVAIRDAFKAARRQLENYARKQRGDVKTHEAPPQGRVSALFPHDDYGTIETLDGQEIFFHRNSVLNDGFHKLNIGDKVRFAEEMGEEGPQASTVQILSKQNAR